MCLIFLFLILKEKTIRSYSSHNNSHYDNRTRQSRQTNINPCDVGNYQLQVDTSLNNLCERNNLKCTYVYDYVKCTHLTRCTAIVPTPKL